MLLASKLLLIRREPRSGSRSDTTQWRSLYYVLIWHLPYCLALEAIVHLNTEQWGTLFLDSFLSEPSVRREIRLLADSIVSDQTAGRIRKTNLSLSEHVDDAARQRTTHNLCETGGAERRRRAKIAHMVG